VLESGFAFGGVIFVGFKRCIKPTQVPHRSGPARGLDIIYVDMPNGEAAKKSSSYNLYIFSSRANSKGAKVVVATCEDSRPSIGELWPHTDKLDEISREVMHTRDAF
jgi:hypothetical protein